MHLYWANIENRYQVQFIEIQIKFNCMNNQKIQYYHKYILKDINSLEERANKHLKRRLDYVNEKLEPINKKIQQMKQQSQHYKQIRDNHISIEETRQDIKQLRADINKFKEAKQYYQHYLDQTEKLVFQSEMKNTQMKQTIRRMKDKLINIKRKKLHQSVELTILKQQNSTVSFVNIKQNSLDKKSQQKPIQKFYKSKLEVQQIKTNNQLRAQLTDKVSYFNNLDSLFKDCFQSRKLVIQRMIGQLQSKLVKNKKIFIKACQMISNKESNKMQFQQFAQLDNDEILTLLISFPSLNKKFTHQMHQKRQEIASFATYFK